MIAGSPTKLSFQNRNNSVFSYYLYSWSVSCPAFGVALLVEGKVAGPRADVQVTEPSTSIAKQEERKTAESSWKFSNCGIWKDSGFNVGLK